MFDSAAAAAADGDDDDADDDDDEFILPLLACSPPAFGFAPVGAESSRAGASAEAGELAFIGWPVVSAVLKLTLLLSGDWILWLFWRTNAGDFE